MNEQTVARVHYFPRQYLRTQDFSDEQAYHIARRRRHNIAHHRWGIVNGLALEVDKDGNFFLQPGVAVDGYGRELIQPQRQPLSGQAFANKESNELNVLLVYSRRSSDQAAPGYAACEADSDQFYRWQEAPIVRLIVPDPSITDWRFPTPQPPAADYDFAPYRTPPDDPTAEWPVYLGKIVRDLSDENEPYRVDMNGRPYAGLIGETITTPSGKVRVRLGSGMPEDDNGFIVAVPEKPADDANAQPKWLPRLQIDRQGQTRIYGQTQVQGNITVAAGGVRLGIGEARRAQPWHIYQAIQAIKTDSEGKQSVISLEEADNAGQDETVEYRRQLRLEMEFKKSSDSEDGQGYNQIVIGAWREDQFAPCLTVSDDCSVRVHGNLTIEGQLIETQPRVQAGLSEAARAYAISSGMTGMAGASTLLGKFYNPQFETVEEFIEILLSGPEMMQQIFAGLEEPEQQEAFAQQLVHPDNDAVQNVVIPELVSAKQTAVINTLLDTDPDAVLTALLSADQTAVLNALLAADQNAVITASVAADQTAVIDTLINSDQSAVITAVINADQSAIITALLNADQAAVITAVINTDQAAVLTALLSADQTAVLNALLAADQNAVILSLLQNSTRIQAVLTNIVDAGQTTAFVAQLGNSQNAALQNDILDHFVNTQTADVIDKVIAEDNTAVINALIADSDTRQNTATTMLTDDDGLNSIVSTLSTNQNARNAFIALMQQPGFDALVNAIQTSGICP